MNKHMFSDLYTGRLGSPEASPRALVARALQAMPCWVGAAMWLRNSLVAPFGLKTGPSDQAGSQSAVNLMQRLPVVHETEAELVTGMDDRHLDFTVRLTKTSSGGFELATEVRPHNRLGRTYLAVVLPAHKLIMRRIARGLAQPVEET
ncbi:MAG: DUF2867 domain-containing protein [Pseudomonadota bacterium]